MMEALREAAARTPGAVQVDVKFIAPIKGLRKRHYQFTRAPFRLLEQETLSGSGTRSWSGSANR
jgi:hypothetical protein